MTDTVKIKDRSGAKNSTVSNTLKCIAVLGLIAVVCVTLLAVANKFLKAEVKLDRSTCALINTIAPTGADDGEAFDSGLITMVDLGTGDYAFDSVDAYNKKYGASNRKVRALYRSVHKDTGAVTYVVEASGKGYVDDIVMLVAYDSEYKVSALVTKSQSESFWSHISDLDSLYAAYVGTSGKVSGDDIAATTHVTVKRTLAGMSNAVSIANDFVYRLLGEAQ